MRFHPSEEQLAIQDSLRGTIADALPLEKLLKVIDTETGFDRKCWDALMALGVAGVVIPEEAGGSGLGLLDLAMSLEVLGHGGATGPVMEHCLTTLAVSMSDDRALREKYLPGLLDGSTIATLALSGDWLPESWNASLDGGKVSGEAAYVPGAAVADIFLVGLKGGGLALASKGEGVEVSPFDSSDLTRRTSALRLAGASATPIFAPGDARVAKLYDAALVLTAADALGGAQYCLDRSVAYAKEREQFGQPIGRFQALKHQLATMALQVEPARALMWYAAYAHDAGLPDAPRAAAMAKAHIADRFVHVARDAVAAHGGVGYTWDYGLNIWFRRSLFDRAYLGSPALHRERAAKLSGW